MTTDTASTDAAAGGQNAADAAAAAAGGAATPPAGAAAPAAGAAADAAAGGGEQAPINTATGKPWTLEEALSANRDLRTENATRRTGQKAGVTEALRAIATAAGIEGVLADETPTVEGLARDLQAKTVDYDRATQQAAKSEADLAIARAAWAAGISPDREKYLAFTLQDDADVSAARGKDNFGATVAAKITALAASDPMLKGNAGSGGRASGADNFGGAGGAGTTTPEQFEAMGYEERLALHNSNPEEYRRLAAN